MNFGMNWKLRGDGNALFLAEPRLRPRACYCGRCLRLHCCLRPDANAPATGASNLAIEAAVPRARAGQCAAADRSRCAAAPPRPQPARSAAKVAEPAAEPAPRHAERPPSLRPNPQPAPATQTTTPRPQPAAPVCTGLGSVAAGRSAGGRSPARHSRRQDIALFRPQGREGRC